MNSKQIALALAATMTISACGIEQDPGLGIPEETDAPVIQITSEGGFAPVSAILGRGPLYTLLEDGRLIYEGPTVAIYPGPLVPNYQVTTITDDQMQQVMDLVEAIGLPAMDRELDDRAASMVADATTEIVTYWDENGEHSYAVYALGIDLEQPQPPATAAFEDLLDLMGDLAGGEAEPYQSDRVRIVAGPGVVNEEFEDVRDWPLDNDSFEDWTTLPNGWMCQRFGPDVLAQFADATQTTVWRWIPGDDPTLADAELLQLAVRPLHPGEPDCPTS